MTGEWLAGSQKSLSLFRKGLIQSLISLQKQFLANGSTSLLLPQLKTSPKDYLLKRKPKKEWIQESLIGNCLAHGRSAQWMTAD